MAGDLNRPSVRVFLPGRLASALKARAAALTKANMPNGFAEGTGILLLPSV